MEEIFSLIQSLTSREWESLQSYLTCFSTHAHDEGGLKQLQLAKILREETICPADTRCCLKIYGVKENTGFEMLKSRLKEKTLDFLLTDISCDKKQELDEADYAVVKIKKKSAQFQQLYYSKKRNLLFYNLLDEIIFLAKEYEQYSMLVEHLRLKKALLSWKAGKENFEKINKEMEFAVKCSILSNKAEHYYWEIMMLNDYEGRQNDKDKLKFLQNAIAEIETENQDIKSPHVNYSLKALEIEYSQLKNDFATAKSKCTQWLDIVRNNKSVYRRQRVGVVYDNLSRCEYYLGEYDLAIQSAQHAQKHFNAGSENYCIALEQEFYALFALKQFDHAIDVAEKMISSASARELGAFRDAKYHYLLANALFKKQRYAEALNLLSADWELSTDKAGWETGLRTLRIMTLVEMQKMDEASQAVHNLKHYFIFTEKKGTPISHRDKKILNLLQLAERKGFAFTLLGGSTDKYMNALQGTSYELRVTKDKEATRHSSFVISNLQWQPFTHEVIPFHEWFASKIKRVLVPEHKAERKDNTKKEKAFARK